MLFRSILSVIEHRSGYYPGTEQTCVPPRPLNLRDPFGLSASSTALCFLKSAAVGAVGAAVVGGLTVGAGTLGASVAAVAAVTLVLGIAAVAGGAALGIDQRSPNLRWKF